MPYKASLSQILHLGIFLQGLLRLELSLVLPARANAWMGGCQPLKLSGLRVTVVGERDLQGDKGAPKV